MAQLWSDVAEMHKPEIQLCESEGIDVIIRNSSDAVCSDQGLGEEPAFIRKSKECLSFPAEQRPMTRKTTNPLPGSCN